MTFITDAQARIHIIFPLIFSLLVGIISAYFFLVKISFATILFFIFLPSLFFITSIIHLLFSSKKWLIAFCYIFLWIGALRYISIQWHHNAQLQFLEGNTFNVIGYIQQKNSCNNRPGQCLQIRTQAFINSTTRKYIPLDLRLLLYSQNNTLNVGDKIKLYNVCIQPSNNQQFNNYLLREGITASLFGNRCFLIKRPFFSLSRFILTLRESLKNRLEQKMSPLTFSLFSSLFLGYKTTSSEEYSAIKNSFKIWGLSHYLARSGLHLVIFVFIFLFLLKRIPLSLQHKLYILATSITIYYILSWSSISFIRATLTYFFVTILSLFDQQINSLHVLTVVTFLVLLKNPLHLFYLDFQLSFLLSLSLLYFNQRTFLQKKLDPH